MNDDLTLSEVRKLVKAVLSTLPGSDHNSVINEYYKFNELLEAHLDDSPEEIKELCMKCGHNGWVEGFRASTKFFSKLYPRKEPEPECVVGTSMVEHVTMLICSSLVIGIFWVGVVTIAKWLLS